jgi:tetratricopeptide (TPR) repeat protein
MEFKQAVSIDRNCLIPEKEMIELLLEESNFDAAMQRSMKILEIDSTDPEARLTFARALKAQNRLDEALSLCRTIIDERASSRSYTLTGQITMAQGNFVEADEMFRNASMLDSSDSDLFFSWGKCLALLGFHEMAAEKFAKASEIDPYDGDIYDSWGNSLKAIGKFSDAAEVYKKAANYL